MTQEGGSFGDHLVDDEPVHVVASGRFVDDASDRPVSVALTDRRLLCTFDDDGFAAVSYDGICSMRSQEYTNRTVRGARSRLLAGAGGYLAINALFGLMVYAMVAGPAAGVAAIALALVTVLGVSAAEHVRRRQGYDVLLSRVQMLSRSHDPTAPNPSGRPSASGSQPPSVGDSAGVDQRVTRTDPRANREWVVAAGGAFAATVGVVAFLAVITAVSVVVVPALVLAIVGGLALVDHGYRHWSDDEIELVRLAETEVAVTTVDGNTFTISVAADEELGTALNRLAFDDDAAPEPTESGPSASSPSGAGTAPGSST